MRASDPGAFSEDGNSVVVARVEQVREYDRHGPTNHWAVLVPVAALTGGFDPGLHPRLRVEFNCGDSATSIQDPPRQGSTVIAVIHPDFIDRAGDSPRTVNRVVSSYCAFMPNRSAMVEVDGLDDPRVADVLKKIQAARLQGDPSTRPAETRQPAATQPAK